MYPHKLAEMLSAYATPITSNPEYVYYNGLRVSHENSFYVIQSKELNIKTRSLDQAFFMCLGIIIKSVFASHPIDSNIECFIETSANLKVELEDAESDINNLDKQVEELNEEVKSLETENDNLELQIKELENRVEELESVPELT